MPVTMEFNDDNRVIAHRDAASGRLLWSRATGFAPASRIEVRHDAADASGGPLAAGAGPIRSAAQFRRALGVPEPRQPRRVHQPPAAPVQMRHDGPASASGPVRSADELRARLGMARR